MLYVISWQAFMVALFFGWDGRKWIISGKKPIATLTAHSWGGADTRIPCASDTLDARLLVKTSWQNRPETNYDAVFLVGRAHGGIVGSIWPPIQALGSGWRRP